MEFTKKQELIYNLAIENVMRKNVITVSPETTIKTTEGDYEDQSHFRCSGA